MSNCKPISISQRQKNIAITHRQKNISLSQRQINISVSCRPFKTENDNGFEYQLEMVLVG